MLTREYEYLPFGTAYSSGTATNVAQRYTYTGREDNPESDRMCYRYRQYSPGIGRFGSRDPIGYEAGEVLYAYVSANPPNRIDPLGDKEICCVQSFPSIQAGPVKITKSNRYLWEVNRAFEVNAQFIEGEVRGDDVCCCKCCEYRQYVILLDRTVDAEGGLALSSTTDHDEPYHEDASPQAKIPYGHRSLAQESNCKYTDPPSGGDERKTGCKYWASDNPGTGVDPTRRTLTMYYPVFHGMIIDTCPGNDGDVVQDQWWHAGWVFSKGLSRRQREEAMQIANPQQQQDFDDLSLPSGFRPMPPPMPTP